MQHAHLRRRLTAVLLADVVGYSRLMSRDEEETHIRTAGIVEDCIVPNVNKHRGRLILTMGDGLLIEFDTAINSVRCALEIQGELADRKSAVDFERRIRLRIGINTGDVITDERDIYGNSVNIAARLEGLAEPGETYVTRGVRDQLEGYPGLSFEDRGARKVKNIQRPIRVYRVRSVTQREQPSWPRQLVSRGRRFVPIKLFHQSRAVTLFSVGLLGIAAVTLGSLPFRPEYSVTSPRSLADGPPIPERERQSRRELHGGRADR